MTIARSIIYGIVFLFVLSCNSEEESLVEKSLEAKTKTGLRVESISLSVQFLGDAERASLLFPAPDNLRFFRITSRLKNESDDTLKYLNMECAKESFYMVAPSIYRKRQSSVCWREGIGWFNLAPGDFYTQEILVACPMSQDTSELPPFKLGFLFQNYSTNGKVDSLEIWSKPIEIASLF